MKARKVWPGMIVEWKVRGHKLRCEVTSMHKMPRGRMYLGGRVTENGVAEKWAGAFLRQRQKVKVLKRR